MLKREEATHEAMRPKAMPQPLLGFSRVIAQGFGVVQPDKAIFS